MRAAFDDVLRFWYERGIAGFRIDVCHAIVKDRELRDDPAATPDDHPKVRERGTRQVFSMNRPEVHDVLKRWRQVSDPDRILVGETYVLELDQLIPYYGSGEDQLHLAFNFLFVHAELDAAELRTIVEAIEDKLPAGAWPVWTGSNHDAGRLATRWAGGDERRARAALLMLLTLRGTPFLYYGDEIALPDASLDPAQALDPVPHRTGDPSRNRDECRTPMQWTGEPGMGFTERVAVAAVRRRPKRGRAARGPGLGAAPRPRADRPAPRACRSARGRLQVDRGAGGSLGLAARAGTVVALNLSDSPVTVDVRGTSLIGTTGESFDGRLGPWEGVVVDG